MAKNKHKILNGGQKRTLRGGPKESKARKKGWSMSNDGFQKGGFHPYKPEKGANKDYTHNKDTGPKRERRKELILNPDFQPLKHPLKKNMATLGNRTTGLPAIGLTSP